MSKFGVKLNHINFDLLHSICPTDSRLRPDIRAYEMGDWDLAKKEKARLE